MNETRDESEPRDDSRTQKRVLQAAALEASGELGYRNLTVEKILDRAELGPEQFFRYFPDPAACYAAAYAEVVDELVADILGAATRQKDWIAGMRAGLEALGRFVEAEPTLARGILLEVQVAGGAAEAKRNEVFERLSRAIDTARRENASRHSPPPIAARFILNMIDAAVDKRLRTDEPAPFAEEIPDLLYVAASYYFGREEAKRRIG